MPMNRRDFHSWGTVFLGGIMSLALLVPGVAYFLDPILRKRAAAAPPGGEGAGAGSGSGAGAGAAAEEFVSLARLSDLKPNVPQAFPVIKARQDAWMKYPPEPVGSVWLIRKDDQTVNAFTAECPHLGCAVNLTQDGKAFSCPCHNSGFDLSGKPTNEIPPRSMDSLEVAKLEGDNPLIRVKFQRFRTLSKEKISLD